MSAAGGVMEPEVDQASEKHYTVNELAEQWQLKNDTVRKLFSDEPGVFCIGEESTRRRKRAYVTMRIPRSVMLRVYYSKVRGGELKNSTSQRRNRGASGKL